MQEVLWIKSTTNLRRLWVISLNEEGEVYKHNNLCNIAHNMPMLDCFFGNGGYFSIPNKAMTH